VAFYQQERTTSDAPAGEPQAVVFVPPSAVRNGSVFIYLDGKAVERKVRTGGVTTQGLRIEEGLYGGEDLIVSPPPELKDGGAVKPRQG